MLYTKPNHKIYKKKNNCIQKKNHEQGKYYKLKSFAESYTISVFIQKKLFLFIKNAKTYKKNV